MNLKGTENKESVEGIEPQSTLSEDTTDNTQDTTQDDTEKAESKQDTTNPILDSFLIIYPEFSSLKNKRNVLNMFKKISLLYPSYAPKNPFDTERSEIYPFFMLVSHYLVIGGYALETGLNKPSGLVASSSIDGVSVSYQAQITKDQFQYFFSQTPYGQEYLAYLNTQAGLRLINNAKGRF